MESLAYLCERKRSRDYGNAYSSPGKSNRVREIAVVEIERFFFFLGMRSFH